MTLEQIDCGFKFMEWLMGHNMPICVIGTTGGEPTLHPLFWTDYVPRLAYFKAQHKLGEVLELHSNASIPVPTDKKLQWPKFFSNMFVGHDMCHRMFKSLSELHLQDYSEICNNIHLCQNEYFVDGTHRTIYLRKKGRAAESITTGFFEELPVREHPKFACSWQDGQRENNALHFTFTPDHINHCGEKSHPLPPLADGSKVDEGQFWEYGMDFNALLHASLDYAVKYSEKHCSQKCMTSFCKKSIKSPLKNLTVSLVKNELLRTS